MYNLKPKTYGKLNLNLRYKTFKKHHKTNKYLNNTKKLGSRNKVC